MNEQEIENYEVDANLRQNYETYSYPKYFSCGEEMLDKYLKNNLKRAMKSENVTGIVAVNAAREIIAFCTLTFLILDKTRVENYLGTGNQLPQVPVVKLSMLAVDKNHQKQGIGGELLMYAFEQAVKVHREIPIKGMYLDSAPKAVAFYKAIGFMALDEESQSGTTPMFIPITRMIAAVNNGNTATSTEAGS